MPDASDFAVPVPPRCFHPNGSPDLPACGELAGYIRPSSNGIPIGYFCHRHVQPGDLPIPSSRVEMRVQLNVEITMCATSFAVQGARREALERLRLAVERIGGVLSLHGVSTTIGRYRPSPATGRKPAEGDRGQ